MSTPVFLFMLLGLLLLLAVLLWPRKKQWQQPVTASSPEDNCSDDDLDAKPTPAPTVTQHRPLCGGGCAHCTCHHSRTPPA